MTFHPTPQLPAQAVQRPRDIRLDVFRGLGMFIIFISHLPQSWWANWIPARFGFSDATEIFVFCSGMASAIAFGKIFDQSGMLMGTARIGHRMWQVYWAHICQFLVIAAGLAALMNSGYLERCCGLKEDYVQALNLRYFFNDPVGNLPGLLSLTYVPNYFDILPMYVALLAMVPVMMFIAAKSRIAFFAAMIGMWVAATLHLVSFPAEPWSNRQWFFNPFAWQLVFFTGFAFMKGWIPAPPVDRRLVWLAVALVLVSIPFTNFRIYEAVPGFQALREASRPLWIKTDLGILRYVHFLALAYIAYAAVGPNGVRLHAEGRITGPVVAVLRKVGQQSLPVFLASLPIAQATAILRDMAGGRGDWLIQAISNIAGLAAIAAVAYIAAWFKSQPWRKVPKPAPAPLPAKPPVAAPSGRTAVPAYGPPARPSRTPGALPQGA